MDVSAQFHAPAALSRGKGFCHFFTEPGIAECPGGQTLSMRQSCRARGAIKGIPVYVDLCLCYTLTRACKRVLTVTSTFSAGGFHRSLYYV